MSKTLTHARNMPTIGAPFAWLLQQKKTVAGETTTYSIEELFRFDNLGSNEITVKAPASASTSGEYQDITRADNATIRFKKNTLILDGETETDITPAAASTDATGLAEVVITLNEASRVTDLYTTAKGFTAFYDKLLEIQNETLIFITGTGYSNANYYTDVTKAPDGYFFMSCKITSDIKFKAGEAISLTLSSNKAMAGITKDLLQTSGTIVTGLLTAIDLKIGGNDGENATVPTKLTDAKAQNVLDGKPVFDSIQTYA